MCLWAYVNSEGRSAHASAQSDQGLQGWLTESFDTTECMNGEQRPRWHGILGIGRMIWICPFLHVWRHFFCLTRPKYLSGPGAYNITGMGSDSMRKAYIESTRRGVFGTTSVRTNAITKKDEAEIPGPNHYQIKEKPFKSRYNQLSSTFASVTARLKDEPIVTKVGI